MRDANFRVFAKTFVRVLYNVRRRDELLGISGVRLRDCGGRC